MASLLGYRRSILNEGRLGYGGKTGMVLTEGYFLTRLKGGYNFYLGQGSELSIDFKSPIGCCGPQRDMFQMQLQLLPQKDYWIAIKSVGRMGLESREYRAIRFRTDNTLNGRAIPPAVKNLRARVDPLGGRVINIMWDVELQPGDVRPKLFKIYSLLGSGPGYIYVPIGQVSYMEGKRRYVYRYLAGEDAFYRVVVRAQTEDGFDDGNERFIVVRGGEDICSSVEEFDLKQLD